MEYESFHCQRKLKSDNQKKVETQANIQLKKT